VENADGSKAEFEYNGNGQLVRESDADGVTSLYAYNGKGERVVTCVDVNKNGVIDYAGPDRVTKVTRSIVNDHGTNVRRSVTSVFAGDNSTVATVRTLLIRAWTGWLPGRHRLTRQSVSWKTYTGSGVWTLATWNPDGTSRIQTFEAGRLVSEMLQDGNGATVAWTSNAYCRPFRSFIQLYGFTNGNEQVSHMTLKGAL